MNRNSLNLIENEVDSFKEPKIYPNSPENSIRNSSSFDFWMLPELDNLISTSNNNSIKITEEEQFY